MSVSSRLFLSGLTLCLAAPLAAKPAPKAPPARAEIQAIYNRINAAAAAKDVDGVFDFDSEDYTQIDQKGRVHDTSDERQDLEKVLEVADSVKAVTAIQGFTGTDAEATVTVKDHVVVRISNGVTHRSARLTADDVSREHWVKTDQGWRRTRSRVLSGRNSLKKNF